MMIEIYIGSHERVQAIEAYRDRLSPYQEHQILSAPKYAAVVIRLLGGQTKVFVDGHQP